MKWRKLHPSELKDGLYVQTGTPTIGNGIDFNDTIYKLIKIDNIFFYTVEGYDWKVNSDIVINNWYETDKTIQMNRDKKINDILDESNSQE